MKYTIIAIILGVVVVAAIGYIVISNKNATPTPLPTTQTPPSTSTSPNKETPPAATPTTKPKYSIADIKFPGADPKKEELDAYDTQVRNMSVDTKTVTITDCVPDPLVLKVTQGSQVTVRNLDSTAHTLAHQQFTIDVAAKGDKTFKVTSDVGVYGYTCNPSSGNPKLSGVFYVVPPVK